MTHSLTINERKTGRDNEENKTFGDRANFDAYRTQFFQLKGYIILQVSFPWKLPDPPGTQTEIDAQGYSLQLTVEPKAIQSRCL